MNIAPSGEAMKTLSSDFEATAEPGSAMCEEKKAHPGLPPLGAASPLCYCTFPGQLMLLFNSKAGGTVLKAQS